MISKKKDSIILLLKELEKLKNYLIVLIFKICYIVLRVSLKNIDFKDFIDSKTLFNNIMSKNIIFEDAEKIKWNVK